MPTSRGVSTTPRTRARRVTATDVAREAGVSQATVSYVLNDTPGQSIPESTRERVRAAVERLGYTPHAAARALRTGRSDTVLFVVPDWPLGPALTNLIEALSERLEEHGLSLLTRRVGSGRPLAGVWRTLLPAAVIGMESLDPDEVRAMRDSGIHVISTLVRERRTADGVLAHSNSMIGAMQLQHLAATGHRHIGYAAPADPRLALFRDLRLDGVRTAAFELGLPEPSVRTVPMDVVAAADAVAAWRAERPAVTAVCAYNDDLAFALLGGMRSLGLGAPHDVAVVGVDDTPLAPFAHPPLTTIRMDLDALVVHLTDAVVRHLRGGAPPRVPRTEALTLVVRESA